MTVVEQRLVAGARDILGRPLTTLEHDQFNKYLELLIKWQRTQRLVGSVERSWLVDNVVLDSLLFARLLPEGPIAVVDIGSGAGLPGVPLKIVREDLAMTLVEARQKRASFLSAAVRELALDRCRVVNARLETAAEELGGPFDAAVARCAGDPQRLLDAVQPVLRSGGAIIASGPPRQRPIQRGSWHDVQWSGGRRLFWLYRKS